MRVTERKGDVIKSYPKGLWEKFIWTFFANEKDGYIGDSNWNPERKDTFWIRVKWWFRNPAHNFTWYVVGIADRDTIRYDERDVDGPGWNRAYSVLKDDRRENKKKYRYWRYLGKTYEFYAGWRGTGAFGFKFKRIDK